MVTWKPFWFIRFVVHLSHTRTRYACARRAATAKFAFLRARARVRFAARSLPHYAFLYARHILPARTRAFCGFARAHTRAHLPLLLFGSYAVFCLPVLPRTTDLHTTCGLLRLPHEYHARVLRAPHAQHRTAHTCTHSRILTTLPVVAVLCYHTTALRRAWVLYTTTFAGYVLLYWTFTTYLRHAAPACCVLVRSPHRTPRDLHTTFGFYVHTRLSLPFGLRRARALPPPRTCLRFLPPTGSRTHAHAFTTTAHATHTPHTPAVAVLPTFLHATHTRCYMPYHTTPPHTFCTGQGWFGYTALPHTPGYSFAVCLYIHTHSTHTVTCTRSCTFTLHTHSTSYTLLWLTTTTTTFACTHWVLPLDLPVPAHAVTYLCFVTFLLQLYLYTLSVRSYHTYLLPCLQTYTYYLLIYTYTLPSPTPTALPTVFCFTGSGSRLPSGLPFSTCTGSLRCACNTARFCVLPVRLPLHHTAHAHHCAPALALLRGGAVLRAAARCCAFLPATCLHRVRFHRRCASTTPPYFVLRYAFTTTGSQSRSLLRFVPLPRARFCALPRTTVLRAPALWLPTVRIHLFSRFYTHAHTRAHLQFRLLLPRCAPACLRAVRAHATTCFGFSPNTTTAIAYYAGCDGSLSFSPYLPGLPADVVHYSRAHVHARTGHTRSLLLPVRFLWFYLPRSAPSARLRFCYLRFILPARRYGYCCTHLRLRLHTFWFYRATSPAHMAPPLPLVPTPAAYHAW